MPDSSTATRFRALDALRGLALGGMILVNNPGSWDHVYAPLEHADWHGFTPTDAVFPAFLFAVGAALHVALKRTNRPLPYPSPASGRGEVTIPWARILRRTAMLFAIGLALNAFPFNEPLHTLRIMGVLQRIALCYGIAAIAVCVLSPRQLLVFALALLLGYWACLVVFATGDPYSLADNAVRRLDLALLGASHLWQGKQIAFDPEGLLGTVPATVNVLAGYGAARWLDARALDAALLRRLFAVAVLLTAAALAWSVVLPINKALWTPSYVLLTCGLDLALLALLIWAIDGRGWNALAVPLEVFGLNPLFLYVLSWLWVEVYALIPSAEHGDAYAWLYAQFLRIASPLNASLLFALAHVALFWLVAWLLWRRRIAIRI